MKKRKSIGLWVGICLLLLGILGSVNVFAAVTEGKAGVNTYWGVCSDY